MELGSTTYQVDYSGLAGQPGRPGTPEHGRLRTISPDVWLNDTTPRLPTLDRAKNAAQSHRKKPPKEYNFCFGNDPPERTTAYMDFASCVKEPGCPRRTLCSPPKESEIFPQPAACQKTSGLSTVGSDFTYLGPDIAHRVYQQRLGDIRRIKVGTTPAIIHDLSLAQLLKAIVISSGPQKDQ